MGLKRFFSRTAKQAVVKERDRKNIAIVCEATGWDEERAKREMDHARELGMSYYRYAHNDVWELESDEEIAALAEELKRKAHMRKESVAIVCEATGWDEERAKREMDHARELGMSYYRYAHNDVWELESDEEIAAFAEELKRSAEERKKERFSEAAQELVNQCGWDTAKAEQSLLQAEELGIKPVQYTRFHMYDLDDEQLAEFAAVLKQKSALDRANEKLYVKYLSARTGWDESTAHAKMAAAKKKGISYFRYLANSCWECDEAGLVKTSEFLKQDSKRISGNKTGYVAEISKATGWPTGKVELEVNKAKVLCEASYEDYYAYKFYEKTPEEQSKYITFGLFSKMRFKYNDRPVAQKYFDDKAEFNRTFANLIHRAWFTNDESLTYESFLSHIEGLDAVLVKPLAATQGIGIEKYAVNESEAANRRFYAKLMGMEPCIVEQYIIQHPEVAKYCDSSVNTVRVTTLNFEGQCKFLYSVFRTGQGAVVDNFHSGGIAASVDMDTGTVITTAADLDGNTFATHPVTGLQFKGFKIPHWDEIRKVCEEATGRVEGVNLVGWDFAVTPEGVDLVEGNPGASYVVAQIPCVEDNIGLRATMADPYL